MEWGELLTKFGPLAIGWVIAGYLIKWILDRSDKDLEGRIRLATALEGLTAIIREKINGKAN